MLTAIKYISLYSSKDNSSSRMGIGGLCLLWVYKLQYCPTGVFSPFVHVVKFIICLVCIVDIFKLFVCNCCWLAVCTVVVILCVFVVLCVHCCFFLI